MAGKSVKRAKVDAQLSNDVSLGLRMACDGNTESSRASGDRQEAMTSSTKEGQEVVEKLQLELDAATKCIEQLRREKDYEVRRVRDEEQTRLSTALKDLESRLKAEAEKGREALKTRLEADATRLSGRYERTVKRLSGDLDKCRNELREEVEKRGMSSSTRGGFEADRVRLLAETRDLKAAKRRLEERVESAAEVDKQRTAEMKRVQEACRAEVAKVSKEANAEIRKLLEELKAKDHQLALLDRNQYPDRGASLPKPPTVTENQVNEPEVTPSALPRPVKPAVSTVGEAVGKSSNQANLETIEKLKRDLEKSNDKLSASESEKKRLRGRVDELCQELAQRNETIANLRKKDTSASSSDQKPKAQPKAVRFLLPGCDLPVLAREIEVPTTTAAADTTTTTPSYDDDNASVTSDMSCSSSLSSTSSVLTPDTTTLYDVNIEKNYHMLLAEHLNLQRSIALLLSSWTGSTSPSSASASGTVLPPLNQPLGAGTSQTSSAPEKVESKTEKPTCRKECIIEKDALKVTIGTLEDKMKILEQNEEQLKQQLVEQAEQNEEMEFRVLELEECAEKCKMTHSGNAADELFEKIRSLEDELSRSKDKVEYYHKLENDSACGSISLGDYIELIKHRQLSAEGRSEMLRLEVMALKRKMEGGPARIQPEVGTLHQKLNRALELELTPSKSGTTKIELTGSEADCDDLLSLCPMNCSMSTTSGYDDNSCASSVADLRLEDLPSEEAWGLEEENDVIVENGQVASAPETRGDLFRDTSKIQTEEYVPVETLRKMEQSWLTRIETMETRLTQAMQSEQRARDQVALVGEEKDRRIAALQNQVDVLEASEFRLAETIQALERLEVTFSQLTSTSPSSSSESSRNPSVSDEDTPTEVLPRIGLECEENKPLESILQSDLFKEHRCTAFGNGCIQCEAGKLLKSSLEKLRSAQNENDSLDKRIKELSEAEKSESELPSTLLTISVPDDDEPVDFKAEYRELESLVKDLKKVLLVDSSYSREEQSENEEKGTEIFEQEEFSCAGLAVRPGGFPDPMIQSWSTVASENCMYSLPNSPVFDLQSPIIGLLRERCKEYEMCAQQLTQQVGNLERERDSLRQTVESGEAAIRELSIRHLELQTSESALTDEVDRLRAKEDWMSARNDELMELISRLETTVDQHRATEVDLRSRIDRHAASQTELDRELEDVRDEARADETRFRRWIRQLEDERTALLKTVDDFVERNTDLESREAGLLCRIRRLESTEVGLKNDVLQLEKALEETGRRGSDEVHCAAIQAVFDVEDGSTQTDADCTEAKGKDEEELVDRAEFFKELLEMCEQANTDLEAKLAQCAVSEKILRGTVEEYEKTDKIWQNKVEKLETKNANVVKQISDLESTIAEQKSALSALRALLLLSDVADDVDDTELVYWAAVENAAKTHCDDVTDHDLSSPHWNAVEARMGLKTDEVDVDSENAKQDQSSASTQQQPEVAAACETTPTTLNHSPEVTTSSSGPVTSVSGPRTALTTERAPRSRSADMFVTLSSRELRPMRASSESRDLSAEPGYSLSPVNTKEPNSPSSSSLAGDTVMERIHRSRQFWSTQTVEPTSAESTPAHNSRRSLIPRIAPVTRSQQEAAAAAVSLPVIRSTPLSPTPSGRSYLPRPINDQRSTNEGKEFGPQATNTEAKVTKEQPGQQTTPKMYTTVLGTNRHVTTPKVSYTGSSSQPPRAVAARDVKVVDSKTPHSSKTNQPQRPLVHVSLLSSSSTDVISKPEVETSLLPVSRRD